MAGLPDKRECHPDHRPHAQPLVRAMFQTWRRDDGQADTRSVAGHSVRATRIAHSTHRQAVIPAPPGSGAACPVLRNDTLPDITPVPRQEHRRSGTRREARARNPDHGQPPRTHRPQSGHGHTMATATPPRIPPRGRRNTGVPDPEDVPPAVATAGTTPACCPGPTARCVRRRAAREAPFRNKRRSADAGDAEGDT